MVPTEKWNDIILKLKQQNSEFPHFIRKNDSGCDFVTFSEATENPEWNVDWRKYLDYDEIRFVEDFAPMYRKFLFNLAN